MRDRSERWDAAVPFEDMTINRPDVQIAVHDNLFQYAISGLLENGIAALAPGEVPKGPGAARDRLPTLLSVSPDRTMVITDTKPIDLPPGLSSFQDGWAFSDMSDAQVVFEIMGSHAWEIIQRMTGNDLSDSRFEGGSVAMAAAGLRLYIYRWKDGYRIHVERSHGQYLWKWICTQLDVVGSL